MDSSVFFCSVDSCSAVGPEEFVSSAEDGEDGVGRYLSVDEVFCVDGIKVHVSEATEIVICYSKGFTDLVGDFSCEGAVEGGGDEDEFFYFFWVLEGVVFCNESAVAVAED